MRLGRIRSCPIFLIFFGKCVDRADVVCYTIDS